LRPEKSVLVIQGDMNLPQAKQLAMLHLGAWGPGSQEPVAPIHEKLPDPPPPTRTWVIRQAGKTIQIRLGVSLPADKPKPASTLAICTWLAKRELAANLPPPLVKAEFHIFPGGAWMIETVSDKSVAEAVEAVGKLLTRLRGKGQEAGALAAARRAWNAERKNRVLHPQQEAAALADRALRGGGLEESVDNLKDEDLQAALEQLFSAEACSYFIVGVDPQDPVWLVKAGLGPVETLN
jgi:predicted Zn-dependent peptidase